MDLIRNLVEHYKSLRFFRRYVDQLVLFVSGLANKTETIVHYSAKTIMAKFIK